ncbi:MAG: HDOD domain-containing protein [Myxococcales bacterium]|nr:HDOD domain-containing protein [Myxococcales bacterium]
MAFKFKETRNRDAEVREKRRVSTDSVVKKVDNLPTLPLVAMKVGEMVNDPTVTATEIAVTMAEDPSLSAKVLKLVNSPYYAIPGGVNDVQRAISFIGFNTLHQVVLSVSVLDALKTPKGSSFDAKGLWTHSLAVGSCAEVLAEHIRFRQGGACFTAGLLHDVGKIALAKASPKLFGGALDDARQNGKCMSDAEKDIGLPSHEKIGSRLAKKWKFPFELALPIEHHHATHRNSVRNELAPSLMSLVDIVSVADEMARVFQLGDSGSPSPEKHDFDALKRLGLSTISVDKIYTELMRKLEVSKSFLNLLDS